ncbi:hypothetical protein [Planctobacterium marinum]|nr:hypothetical protein [Planctobacterium marinum]
MIRFIKEQLLNDATDALHSAVAEVARNQMCHESFATTLSRYIDMAKLVVFANQGKIHGLVTETNTRFFVERYDSIMDR